MHGFLTIINHDAQFKCSETIWFLRLSIKADWYGICIVNYAELRISNSLLKKSTFRLSSIAVDTLPTDQA